MLIKDWLASTKTNIDFRRWLRTLESNETMEYAWKICSRGGWMLWLLRCDRRLIVNPETFGRNRRDTPYKNKYREALNDPRLWCAIVSAEHCRQGLDQPEEVDFEWGSVWFDVESIIYEVIEGIYGQFEELDYKYKVELTEFLQRFLADVIREFIPRIDWSE